MCVCVRFCVCMCVLWCVCVFWCVCVCNFVYVCVVGGIHLRYVIHVTPRACEIEEKPSVSVEPVWRFLLLLVVCFCLSRRLCSLAVDIQGVRTHGKEEGKGRREPCTSAGRQTGCAMHSGRLEIRSHCGFTWPHS